MLIGIGDTFTPVLNLESVDKISTDAVNALSVTGNVSYHW
jgi:hypothetical protein